MKAATLPGKARQPRFKQQPRLWEQGACDSQYPPVVSPSLHKSSVLPSLGWELAGLRLQKVTWSRHNHKFCSWSLREKGQLWGKEFYLFYLFPYFIFFPIFLPILSFLNVGRYMLNLDCVLRCGAVQQLLSKRQIQVILPTNFFFYQADGSYE